MPGRSIKLGPHVRHVNRLGASIAENELRAHARENYDLWGMLLGYSIRVESLRCVLARTKVPTAHTCYSPPS